MKPNKPNEQPLPRLITSFPIPEDNEVGQEIGQYKNNWTAFLLADAKKNYNDYLTKQK